MILDVILDLLVVADVVGVDVDVNFGVNLSVVVGMDGIDADEAEVVLTIV